jgi:hypothetical protein
VDRLHEGVGYAHELIVRGQRTGKSCHMVLDDLHGVAQTIRERHRGALGKGVRGKRFSADELRHDVDEGEGEGTQVLPGRVRS